MIFFHSSRNFCYFENTKTLECTKIKKSKTIRASQYLGLKIKHKYETKLKSENFKLIFLNESVKPDPKAKHICNSHWPTL